MAYGIRVAGGLCLSFARWVVSTLVNRGRENVLRGGTAGVYLRDSSLSTKTQSLTRERVRYMRIEFLIDRVGILELGLSD